MSFISSCVWKFGPSRWALFKKIMKLLGLLEIVGKGVNPVPFPIHILLPKYRCSVACQPPTRHCSSSNCEPEQTFPLASQHIREPGGNQCWEIKSLLWQIWPCMTECVTNPYTLGTGFPGGMRKVRCAGENPYIYVINSAYQDISVRIWKTRMHREMWQWHPNS